MVRHIVMWKLDPEAGERDAVIGKMCEKLEGLPGKIGWIRDFEAGIDRNRSAAAWDLVLNSTFDSFEDLQRYQVDPAHKEVAAFVGSVVSERAVVDYEI